MSLVSLTGKDTLNIDGRIFRDFADGDAGALTYPDDLVVAKVSKNGNVVYAVKESGRLGQFSLRLILGGDDDKYLNSRLQQIKNDAATFTLLAGFFTKRVGDGKGNIKPVVYQLDGGVFKRQVDAKTNSEGDTEQSVAVYTMTWGNADRSIQ